MFKEYNKEIQRLLEWYQRAKRAAIFAESLDTLNKAYIQPLHEQRYCLDHFVRAIDYYENTQLSPDIKAEKVRASFASAIAHLQRCYSDSIEWMLVSVKDYYVEKLDGYDKEVIREVFPEYYTDIRPVLNDLTVKINEYKSTKKVEESQTEPSLSKEESEKIDAVANGLLSINVAETMSAYIAKLDAVESELIHTQLKNKKKSRREKIFLPGLIGLGTASIGAIIAAIILKVVFGI